MKRSERAGRDAVTSGWQKRRGSFDTLIMNNGRKIEGARDFTEEACFSRIALDQVDFGLRSICGKDRQNDARTTGA